MKFNIRGQSATKFKRIHYSALTLACVALSGCGFISVTRMGGSPQTGGNGGVPPEAPNWTVTLSSPLFQDKSFTFTPPPYPGESGPQITYQLVGSLPGISVDPANGKMSGFPDDSGDVAGLYYQVSKNGVPLARSSTFTATVHGDPLTKHSWHLNNTGQLTFAATAADGVVTQHAREGIRMGYTGNGVKLAVSDTGVEATAGDLEAGMVLANSRDYSQPTAPFTGDPTAPRFPGSKDHGTAVTGVAAARAWNDKGGRGIAPGASIAGLRFLPFYDEPRALHQLLGDYDVHNSSWGVEAYAPVPLIPGYVPQIRMGTGMGRGGKGMLYTRSAGNGYLMNPVPGVVLQATTHTDAELSLPDQVVVAAVNSNGVKSSYSTIGSSIWLSAFGGEYGYDDDGLAELPSSAFSIFQPSLFGMPAIVATDQAGCLAGFSQEPFGAVGPYNSLDRTNPKHPLNQDCDYVATMNGTSAAAPTVAGAIALILEANPNLTWRDVKHVLAVTAQKIDANRGPGQPFPWPLASGGASFFVPENAGHRSPAWVTNAAGHPFHLWYGFGLLDISAALTMAKTYNSGWGPMQEMLYAAGPSVSFIPDNDPNGVESTITVPAGAGVIEAVQIEVSIDHEFPFELGIELYSPAGTKSIVLHNYNNLIDNQGFVNFHNVPMLTNAFYGEQMAGDWKLKVADAGAGDQGTLSPWKIRFYYH